MLGPAFIVSPGLIQKAYGARDERAVRHGIAWAGVFMFVFALAPALIGLSAYAIDPGLSSADLALPTLLTRDVTPLVGGLAVAAVFSAELSSADAVLFMLATSASRDLYRGLLRPHASDAELLRVARLAAVGGAAAGIGLAMMHRSVIDAVQTFYSLLVAVLFVPVLGALFVRGAGRREGLASVCFSVPALVIVQLATQGRGYGIVTPTLAGVLAGAAAFAAVRLLRR
jgi:SSS family solute:Na+ symporter